jgi:hypothetical protein
LVFWPAPAGDFAADTKADIVIDWDVIAAEDARTSISSASQSFDSGSTNNNAW